jgi:hypothetical protein
MVPPWSGLDFPKEICREKHLNSNLEPLFWTYVEIVGIILNLTAVIKIKSKNYKNKS